MVEQVSKTKNINSEIAIDPSWAEVLKEEFNAPYFQDLKQFLLTEKKNNKVIYPPKNNIFRAFNLTPFNKVKVVILGQDPYHGESQAHGLAFSVNKGIAIPPSLQNIMKELSNDVGFKNVGHGDLSSWAKQGVLLLNTVLTVREGEAYSHRNQGWERFTDQVITKLNSKREGLVFVLWGSGARAKASFIDRNKHLVLESPHPSPLSAHRGFLGNKHFSQINDYLLKNTKAPINWQLPN